MTLQTQRVRTLEQVRRVAEGNEPVDFAVADRESAYAFIRRTLVEFSYTTLSKSDKGAVKAYLGKMTGLSRAQLTRLMAQHRNTGCICDRRDGGPAQPFEWRYSAADVGLLAEVDAALGQRCGPATRAVLRRQFELFADERFERLARLSNGHLYNLRKSQTYRRKRAFHADNGSEYINHRVAALLNKLHIGQFTKSRARQCNDNALVESKNGSVIRTYLGYDHIPQRFAVQVNAFTYNVLSPYLNHHRPCLFATVYRDAKGRIRKRYLDHDLATPYEKLKSLTHAPRFLKPGVTFTALDAVAYAHSDLDAALAVNAARDELFRTLGADWGCAA